MRCPFPFPLFSFSDTLNSQTTFELLIFFIYLKAGAHYMFFFL